MSALEDLAKPSTDGEIPKMAPSVLAMISPAPTPKTQLGVYRILSPNAGVRVSPICLGAMSIGGKWDFMGSIDKKQSFALLDAFVDAGGNFIDTASNYQNEDSEKWIGEWMTERENRDLIVLATKFTTQYRSWELGKGKTVNFQGNSRKTLHMSVRDSLKKLQTDYIDLLYIHWYVSIDCYGFLFPKRNITSSMVCL